MKADIKPEHGWLEQFSGAWEVVVAPDTPADQVPKFWTERGRSLNGVWALIEGEGEMPGGGPAKTLLTLGYDPAKGKYIGSWIGSMMTHQWIYEGGLNDAGELVLDSVGPDFTTPGKRLNYQDIYSFEGSDKRHLRSQVQKDDGTWQEFMRMSYRRV